MSLFETEDFTEPVSSNPRVGSLEHKQQGIRLDVFDGGVVAESFGRVPILECWEMGGYGRVYK